MSRYEDLRSILKEEERQPILNTTDWKTSQDPVKTQKDTEDVSPRSKGETPLSSIQTEEIRRRLEEAKERAKASLVADVPSGSASQSAQLTSDPPPGPNLNPVSPELLRELRKIIREEVEELNKGDIPEAGKSPRPTDPSSTARPQSSHTSSRDTDDKRATAATVSSPNTTQSKEVPKKTTVRFSVETKPAVSIMPRGSVDDSKKVPASKARGIELTAIDKTWGTLFEKDATPTRRIEHILQGLAAYIIDEFIPQGSIVVTPEKMAAFYSHHRLDKEVFPLAVLFRSRPNDLNEALAGLYQDFGCQYFLVPTDSRSRPAVPGLTPAGFSHWLVTMIQAYPDEEAKRLGKIVSALPIEADSLLDGKPERLPKQISRYLLPEKPLRRSQKLVDEAMRDFMEDVSNTPTSRPKGLGSGNGGSSGKPTPIAPIVEKRPSTITSSGPGSRYTPEAPNEKNRADEGGGSGHDRERRANSMSTSSSSRDPRDHDSGRRDPIAPPPLGPGHLGRAYSLDNNNNNVRSSRTPPHAMLLSSSSSSSSSSFPSSSRRNRSPQRKPHSQSVPAGLDRGDDSMGGALDRIRGSATLSAVAATVAAVVLGSSSSSTSTSSPHVGGGGPRTSSPPSTATASSSAPAQSNSSSDASTRGGPRSSGGGGGGGGGDFVLHRERRAGVEESTPRVPPPPPPPPAAAASAYLRDNKAGVDSGSGSRGGGGGGGRSGRKRSVVLPDTKGPTWDDYMRGPAPRSPTSAFGRRGDAG